MSETPEVMSETPELKPCPFCGTAAVGRRMFPGKPDVYGTIIWWNEIQCAGCHAVGPSTLTHKEARAAWNRRAEERSGAPAPGGEGPQRDGCDRASTPQELLTQGEEATSYLHRIDTSAELALAVRERGRQ